MLKKILLIASTAAIFALSVFYGIRTYSRYAIGFTKVYVASHQLSQRKMIGMDDLYEIEVPKDFIGDDVYVELDDILGKYVRLSFSIPKDSFIYKGAVEEDIRDLSHSLLKENEVNYDLRVGDVDINGSTLGVNMLMDFYLTIKDRDRPISDLLLSNARITGLYDSSGKAIKEYDRDNRVYSISFAIDRDDVVIMNKALLLGEIRAVAGKDVYSDKARTMANEDSVLFEYLD